MGILIPKLYPSAKKISILNCHKEDWGWEKPMGITIHDAADRNIDRVISWLNHEKLGYHIIIDTDGSIIQTSEFDKRINHAGNAIWNKLSPNRHHIAICLMSWGKLVKKEDKFYAWNGSEIAFNAVANRLNFLGDSGYYDSATQEQERSLIDLIYWLISFDIDPINICGHDEACIPKGRKVDPGGVLLNSMDYYRKKFSNY